MSEEKPEKGKGSKEEVLDIANELNSLGLEWSRQKLTLRRFAEEICDPQPILICKGKYETCGQPTPSEPLLTAQLLAWCNRSRLKIEAGYWRFYGKKILPKGPKFKIDDDYEGWLEIVSEEGKEMSYIQSVAKLARCTNKTFVLMKSMHAHQRTLEGDEWESCTLHIGYRITVGEEILTDGLPGCGKLLRCKSALVWEPSETVYLPVEGSGRFALVTGNDPLVGPKRVSFFGAWKLPVNVKVMEGSQSPTVEPPSSHMHLYSNACEKVLTVLPMKEGAHLVHIPIQSEMELRVLDNLEDLQKLPRYCEILQRVQLTFIPKVILRETHDLPSTPGQLSSSPNQNLMSVLKYLSGWFYSTNGETFEERGYDNAFILDPEEHNGCSIEMGCVKYISKEKAHNIRRWIMDHKTPNIQPTNEKIPPMNIEKERISDESETRNRMDHQVIRVLNSHEFYLAAPPKNNVPSVETGCIEPCVEQHTSRLAAVHEDKSLPLRIDNEKSTDEALETLNLDDPLVRRFPDRHKSNLVPPPKESSKKVPPPNDSSMETETMQPSFEQQSSRTSADRLEKNNHLYIKFKKTKDVQPTSNLDGAQIKRLRSESVKNVQHTSSTAAIQPTKVRRSLRIEALQRKDDQQTFSLASVQPSKVRRSPRINTLQQKGDQQSSGMDTDLTQ